MMSGWLDSYRTFWAQGGVTPFGLEALMVAQPWAEVPSSRDGVRRFGRALPQAVGSQHV